MDLKKLPPSLLVVLGLACTRAQPTVGPCLSQPYDPATEDVGPCLSPPHDPSTEDPDPPPPEDPGDVGPCLSPPEDPGDVGPCLSPQRPSDGSDTTTIAQAGDVHDLATTPAAAGSRRDALDRVLARATLPPDVAERLRRRSGLE
jgi:hypothetical protein